MLSAIPFGIGGIFVAIAILVVVAVGLIAITLRRVVPTNEVHIVQTTKKPISFGMGQDSGNTYYEWPSWVPVIGLTVTKFPVSVFDISLGAYEAYDKDRVPFVVDITAFFRIAESNVAAQRVADFDELQAQLRDIVRGVVRTTLAQHEIDTIMVDRAQFGDKFTDDIAEQLKNWGVETVKNIELMDIRDSQGSQVIANIMAKRTSTIEKDSRVAVAENKQLGEIAEINARREVELQNQQAAQVVGQRTADKDRAVGIANETARQEVLTQARETRVREMEVERVSQVQQAEIARDVAVVEAEQDKKTSIIEADATKQTSVIRAEGDKQQTILTAEGKLEAAVRDAKGVQAVGEAHAEAEKAMQLAPVTAQITLAKEIGENVGYQTYLIEVRKVEAAQTVGVEQAKALASADVKVITNAGKPVEGMSSVMDLFSSQGGTSIAGLIEGLSQSEAGKALVDRVTGTKS